MTLSLCGAKIAPRVGGMAFAAPRAWGGARRAAIGASRLLRPTRRSARPLHRLWAGTALGTLVRHGRLLSLERKPTALARPALIG